MHVVVVLEELEKFTHLRPILIAERGKSFCDVTDLARDHRPFILRQPLRDRMEIGRRRGETRARRSIWDVVILPRGQRLDFLRAGLDRSGFNVRGRVGMVRFD